MGKEQFAVNETDDVLVDRVRRGENAAFEMLFLRHYQRVYRVLYNLVGTREEAEDLAQETFLAFYHKPPRVGANDTLAPWLCRVALNRGYNVLRGERRAQQRLDRLDVSLLAEDPHREAERAEERAYVRAVLANLPERQSTMLLLRYAGLSYSEIAATLGIAASSVGTLLARAERAFLSKCQQPLLDVM